MFNINDNVIHKSAGACIVADIVTRDFGNGVLTYYYLKPKYPNTMNKSLEIYLPVDKENNFIRKPIEKEKADLIIKSFPQMKIIWIDDNKARKAKIEEIYHRGEFSELCQLLKLLYKPQADLPKPISPTERTMLSKIKGHVFDEFAIALGILPDFVEKYIEQHL